MQELKKIWAFGLPYLRPYMFRFVAGVALGMIFGLSNGLFVVSVDSLFTRLTQPTQALTQSMAGTEKADTTAPIRHFQQQVSSWWKDTTHDVTENWLPRIGQPVTWKQALGSFSLLPLIMGLRALSSYLSTYCLTWVSARVIRDMQVAALKKAQELSVAFFKNVPPLTSTTASPPTPG
jgi:ABC-type multidrug transport system fused ATPase/permease subunit